LHLSHLLLSNRRDKVSIFGNGEHGLIIKIHSIRTRDSYNRINY
jgi:hypothetical protein